MEDLTPAQIKRNVKRLLRIDELVLELDERKRKIETTPRYWTDFYSGYEPVPTKRCQQLLDNIEKRNNALFEEQSKLFLTITEQQAREHGYCTDALDDSEFKAA